MDSPDFVTPRKLGKATRMDKVTRERLRMVPWSLQCLSDEKMRKICERRLRLGGSRKKSSICDILGDKKLFQEMTK